MKTGAVTKWRRRAGEPSVSMGILVVPLTCPIRDSPLIHQHSYLSGRLPCHSACILYSSSRHISIWNSQFRGKPVVWMYILFPQVQTWEGAFINEKKKKFPAAERLPPASHSDVWGAQAIVMPAVWVHLFSLFISWVLSPCGLHHSQRPANSNPPQSIWSIAVLFKHTPSLFGRQMWSFKGVEARLANAVTPALASKPVSCCLWWCWPFFMDSMRVSPYQAHTQAAEGAS